MSEQGSSVAVLMTCYNRVETTVAALEHLFASGIPQAWRLDVYLVDDGSRDGTGAVVAQKFPNVKVIPGSGSLYWAGGMRLAWNTAALEGNYDSFLWLNDDTRLYPGALRMMWETAREVRQRTGADGIVVGATIDPVSQKTSYGALGTSARDPEGTATPFRPNETINGNVVWVPRTVWQQLGNLRPVYTHAMGDTDYGLRARQRSIPVWLTARYVGACRTNTSSTWRNPSVSMLQRFRALHSPKGCPPSEYIHIIRLMHRWTWPLHLLNLYRRVVFP